VGTFDLNDPNVFKALIPAAGAAGVLSQKKGDEKMFAGGRVRLNKKKRPGMRLLKK